MTDIHVPNHLAERLLHWHSSMYDPIYAVGSSGLAKRNVPADLFKAVVEKIDTYSKSEAYKDSHAELREIFFEMKGILGEVEDRDLRESIARGMARTIWALAWADEAEQQEDGPSLSGCDITAVAPDTPESAYRTCDDALTQFLETNELNLRKFYNENKGRGCYKSPDRSPSDFGHQLALIFAGYGGDFSLREYKQPYVENYYYSFVDEWIAE